MEIKINEEHGIQALTNAWFHENFVCNKKRNKPEQNNNYGKFLKCF